MTNAGRPNLSELAVILHADIAGSTALVQRDEVLAHERMQSAFRLLSSVIEGFSGVTHELRGDALVAEFKRASDSVCAALAFQRENLDRNEQLPDDIKPEFRIGISLGEVVVADGTITGAGVVIAQRLEQLAQPGRVVVQGTVAETVPIRLPLLFQNLGEHSVKGFTQPIRVCTVDVKPGESLPAPHAGIRERSTVSPENPQSPSLSSAKVSKPSIAVLPFENMSGDPQQEYFSDGITEDIITELSHFNDLFVTARNSSFKFKGRSVDAHDVGQKLGVQYLVTGSVRRAGQRIRINAQLVDVETGNHVWADRYDREIEDIFSVQDEVVRIITSTLVGRVAHDHRGRAQLKSKVNLDAYDWFIQGRELFYNGTSEDNKAACKMFQQAVSLDSEYAAAYALLAETFVRDWATFWNEPLDTSYEDAWACAKKALELDDSDSGPRTAMGYAYYWKGNFEQAIVYLKKALALNPGDMRALNYLARVEAATGQPELAIERLAEVRRNNPYGKYDWNFVPAYYLSQRYSEAIQVLESIQNPAPLMMPWMAAVYVRMGEIEKACRAASNFVEIAQSKLEATKSEAPNSWLGFVAERCKFSHQKDIDGFAEDLRKAGF